MHQVAMTAPVLLLAYLYALGCTPLHNSNPVTSAGLHGLRSGTTQCTYGGVADQIYIMHSEPFKNWLDCAKKASEHGLMMLASEDSVPAPPAFGDAYGWYGHRKLDQYWAMTGSR